MRAVVDEKLGPVLSKENETVAATEALRDTVAKHIQTITPETITKQVESACTTQLAARSAKVEAKLDPSSPRSTKWRRRTTLFIKR